MDRFYSVVDLKLSDLLVFLIYGVSSNICIISNLIVAAERYKER
jgi:hypothetical protein